MPPLPSLLLAALLVLGTARPAAATALLRYPSQHGDLLVFVHADEVWTAPARGGKARRLTSQPGTKLNARISPDGERVAFTALVGPNIDVYVAPARGGEARRLTYHPAFDSLVGWTPDGRSVLFTSRRSSFTHPLDRLFTVPREGGAAIPLPLAQGGPAAYSPDGRRIAYNRNSSESWSPWVGYRGGRQAAVSIYDFASRTETTLPRGAGGGSDVFPMWSADGLTFASDRDGRMNLYRYDLKAGSVRQLTHHRDADVRHPSLDEGRIVYELGPELHRLSLSTGRDETVRIEVAGPLPERAPRSVAVPPYLTSFDLAPDGSRVLLGARGELLEVAGLAAEGAGPPLRTQTSGVRERDAVYSPQGDAIAYLSDAGGEGEIHLRRRGEGEGRALTHLGAGYRQGLRWSPDGGSLLFTDQSWTLYLLEIAGGVVTRIDASRAAPIEAYAFTPDGAAVVYAKTGANQLSRLYAYDRAAGRSTVLGDGMTDDSSPAVDASDPAGARLYYLSAREFRTSFSDFEQTFNFNDTVGIYSRPLGAAAGGETRLPVEGGSLSQLAAAGGRLYYLARDRRTGARALHTFDLATQRDELLAPDVADYRVAGGTIAFRSGDRLVLMRPGAPGASEPRREIDLAALSLPLDPVAEWRQIFHEAWRLERDYFHEPAMHGVDWAALGRRYEAYLPSVDSRGDLNALLGLMVAELGTSHAWAFGGDAPQAGGPATGVLGADFEVDRGRYRIARILSGPPGAGAPLAETDAKPGESLLAFAGEPVTADRDLYAALVDRVGKATPLALSPTPDPGPGRTVTVEPVADDMPARYAAWVEGNRREVERRTDGRCGYLHVPDTGRNGIARFARDYFAQADREALIVDSRWNGGGLFPAAMIEHLSRRPLARYGQRQGDPVRVPGAAIAGPKVLLTNNNTGSGGDAFALYFRAAGLGPIVGGRTLGATIGNVGMPGLVDNGEIGVPALAYLPPAGSPPAENSGVTPDIEVAPAVEDGGADADPQLARAIAEILAALDRR